MSGAVVGHLPKWKTDYLVKFVSFFLCANHGKCCCIVEFKGERVNIGDGERLQIP